MNLYHASVRLAHFRFFSLSSHWVIELGSFGIVFFSRGECRETARSFGRGQGGAWGGVAGAVRLSNLVYGIFGDFALRSFRIIGLRGFQIGFGCRIFLLGRGECRKRTAGRKAARGGLVLGRGAARGGELRGVGGVGEHYICIARMVWCVKEGGRGEAGAEDVGRGEAAWIPFTHVLTGVPVLSRLDQPATSSPGVCVQDSR